MGMANANVIMSRLLYHGTVSASNGYPEHSDSDSKINRKAIILDNKMLRYSLVFSAVALAHAADDSMHVEISADGEFVHGKHSLGAHGGDLNSLLHERVPKKYSKEKLHHAHDANQNGKTHRTHSHHDVEAQVLLQSEQARR